MVATSTGMELKIRTWQSGGGSFPNWTTPRTYWLQTAGLPAPDLYTPIRSDMDDAQIPAGVSLGDARGLVVNRRWYE
jgi:hypothetical protein